MKVVTVNPVRILCTSGINYGNRYDGPDYEYIGGDSGVGYGYGEPD